MVKYLADNGADINKKGTNYGETALQHVDGRSGLEEIRAYLKMKKSMQAVLAAQLFKSEGANAKKKAATAES